MERSILSRYFRPGNKIEESYNTTSLKNIKRLLEELKTYAFFVYLCSSSIARALDSSLEKRASMCLRLQNQFQNTSLQTVLSIFTVRLKHDAYSVTNNRADHQYCANSVLPESKLMKTCLNSAASREHMVPEQDRKSSRYHYALLSV